MGVLSAIVIPIKELDAVEYSSAQGGHCSTDAHHLCNDPFGASVNIH